MKSALIFCLLIGISYEAPLEGPGNRWSSDDLPGIDNYQPEKPPSIPIKLGHRSECIFLRLLF